MTSTALQRAEKTRQQMQQQTQNNTVMQHSACRLQTHQTDPLQQQDARLDVFDFPPSTNNAGVADAPTIASKSEQDTAETVAHVQSEASGRSVPEATPRQSKQCDRLRRLIENGDHELGQNDEAEVRDQFPGTPTFSVRVKHRESERR